jgi:hypothetical protein
MTTLGRAGDVGCAGGSADSNPKVRHHQAADAEVSPTASAMCGTAATTGTRSPPTWSFTPSDAGCVGAAVLDAAVLPDAAVLIVAAAPFGAPVSATMGMASDRP